MYPLKATEREKCADELSFWVTRIFRNIHSCGWDRRERERVWVIRDKRSFNYRKWRTGGEDSTIIKPDLSYNLGESFKIVLCSLLKCGCCASVKTLCKGWQSRWVGLEDGCPQLLRSQKHAGNLAGLRLQVGQVLFSRWPMHWQNNQLNSLPTPVSQNHTSWYHISFTFLADMREHGTQNESQT